MPKLEVQPRSKSYIRLPKPVQTQSINSSNTNNESQCDINLDSLALKFEEQASKFAKVPCFNVKDTSDLSRNMYLEQLKSDSKGRIPISMIGIMPHKLNNHITSFVSKYREALPSPLKHKDRFKNLNYLGMQGVEAYKHLDLASRHIDDINKDFDKKLKASQDGKKDILAINSLTSFIKSNDLRIKKAVKESFQNLMQTPAYSVYFENKSHQDWEKIINSFMVCLKPGFEIGIRSKIKKTHKHMHISNKDFEAFINNLQEIMTRHNFEDEEIKLIIDRVFSFEKDIVTMTEIL